MILFKLLTKDNLTGIIDIMVEGLKKRLADRSLKLCITDKAKELIIERGYDPLYGARPVKRTIQRYIVNELSKRILAGDVNREKPIKIGADDKGLTFAN